MSLRGPDHNAVTRDNVGANHSRNAVAACSGPPTAQTATVIPIQKRCPFKCLDDDRDGSQANEWESLVTYRRCITTTAVIIAVGLAAALRAEDWP